MPETAISTQLSENNASTTLSENQLAANDAATISEKDDTAAPCPEEPKSTATPVAQNDDETRETGNQKLETASITALSAPARQQRALARVGAERAPRCCHIKINGLRCGSPALRANVLCYFHDKWLNTAADDIRLPPVVE